MEEINSNEYKEKIKRYTDAQLGFELAILQIQKDNLYIQEKSVKEEFKRRMRE